MSSSNPIGVFDSGVGGLSVLLRIREELPNEDLLYIADSKHAPYGNKTREYIEERSITISRFLVAHDVKAIVVACNTATSAAISKLRSIFDLPFIAIEPAVKPGVRITESGIIGVLATEETLRSEKFRNLRMLFENKAEIICQPCPGLAEQVERLNITGEKTVELLNGYISPLLKRGVDTIVLGCTHYPFLLPLIKDIAGPDVKIIDTGTAVARELARRLNEEGIKNSSDDKGRELFWTSGEVNEYRNVIKSLWGKDICLQKLPVNPL
jgi:glutamate racemase